MGTGDLIRGTRMPVREYGLKSESIILLGSESSGLRAKPEYITYMRNQLTETIWPIMEKIFEVWFDGSKWAVTDAYGAVQMETRIVIKFSITVAPWGTFDLVRKLRPALCFLAICRTGISLGWGMSTASHTKTTLVQFDADSVYAGMPEFSEKWATGPKRKIGGRIGCRRNRMLSIRRVVLPFAYEDH